MSIDICRACLQSDDVRYSILDEQIKMGFEQLTSISVYPGDNLPQRVCKACMEQFTLYLEFKKKVLNSHKFLVEALSEGKEDKEIKSVVPVTVKEEIRNDDDDANLDACEALQNDDVVVDKHFDHDYIQKKDDDDMNIDNIEKKDIQLSEYIVIKKKPSRKSKSTNPRKVITVDPEKIRIVRLTLEQQIQNHEREGRKPEFLAMPHKCMQCYKGFNFERKLQAHVENLHKPGQRYSCSICSRIQSSHSSYLVHLQRHELRYECRGCDATFSEKLLAIHHYSEAHEGIAPRIPCRLCDRVFRHKSTLNGHMRSEHALSQPTCQVCNKVFKSRHGLEDHMSIHTGEKDYSCTVCEKRFRLKAEVKVHMRSHSVSRPHYCSECDVQFKSLGSFRQHIKTSRKHGHAPLVLCVA